MTCKEPEEIIKLILPRSEMSAKVSKRTQDGTVDIAAIRRERTLQYVWELRPGPGYYAILSNHY